jgi:integrase
MERRKLTDSSTPRLSAPTDKRYAWYYDSALRGFAMRVSQAGNRTWVVRYGPRGGQVTRILGTWPELSEKDARAEAMQVLAHPVTPQAPSSSETVEALVTRFRKTHRTRIKGELPDHDRRVTADLDWLVETAGDVKVKDLTVAKIVDLLDPYKDRPFLYNKRRGLIRQVLNKGKVAPNPVTREDIPPMKLHSRKRALNKEERKRLIAAISACPHVFVSAYMFCMLYSTCRPGELLKLKWDDVSLEEEDREWFRLERTKSGKTRVLPMSPPFRDIISQIPKVKDNPYVFVGGKKGSHLKQVKKTWAKILAEAEIKDLRLHDLRRSAASLLRDRGVHIHVIQQMLGHSSPIVTQIYLSEDPELLRDAVGLLTD